MARPRVSLEKRFWDRVSLPLDFGDCWEWLGTKDRQGYGNLHMPHGSEVQTRKAHRVSFSLFVGKLDSTLTIDHLCRNPSCVNPYHLEQVSWDENMNRRPVTEQCPQGHPYVEGNLAKNQGNLSCLICKRERDRERWRKKHGYYLRNPEG